MSVVAKRKPKTGAAVDPPEPARTSGNRSGVPLYAYIPPELRQALNTYLETTRPKPSLTSAVEVALEEFLAARGHWPPPP